MAIAALSGWTTEQKHAVVASFLAGCSKPSMVPLWAFAAVPSLCNS
jgi:hypothetical protein